MSLICIHHLLGCSGVDDSKHLIFFLGESSWWNTLRITVYGLCNLAKSTAPASNSQCWNAELFQPGEQSKFSKKDGKPSLTTTSSRFVCSKFKHGRGYFKIEKRFNWLLKRQHLWEKNTQKKRQGKQKKTPNHLRPKMWNDAFANFSSNWNINNFFGIRFQNCPSNKSKEPMAASLKRRRFHPAFKRIE